VKLGIDCGFRARVSKHLGKEGRASRCIADASLMLINKQQRTLCSKKNSMHSAETVHCGVLQDASDKIDASTSARIESSSLVTRRER
jgi:hypothetical protein